jgi:hypothetical protein
MVITGYIRRVGADLDPARVIDPAVVAAGDPAAIAAACLAAVDPGLAERAREGDLLLVDGACSGGAGAEAAVIALQSLGLAALLCRATAPDLQALGATYGLPVIPTASDLLQLAEGDLLRLDLERGHAESGGRAWAFAPLDGPALAAVRRAQLLARMRRVVEEEGYAE